MKKIIVLFILFGLTCSFIGKLLLPLIDFDTLNAITNLPQELPNVSVGKKADFFVAVVLIPVFIKLFYSVIILTVFIRKKKFWIGISIIVM